jgi:hypothetical protein
MRIMALASQTLRWGLLLAAGLLSVASTQWPEQQNVDRLDETWLVENLWDGQTAVDPSLEVVLTLGHRDFQTNALAEEAIAKLELRYADGAPVGFDLAIGWEGTVITPTGGLAADADYVLDLSPIRDHGVQAQRGFPPDPIRFSTCEGPRVVGLWRSESTLIVEFSQRMSSESLALSPQAVDVVWQEEGELKSLTADRNLAGYQWATDGPLFLLAPFDFVDPAWVTVSSQVQGSNGVRLDGNGDCVPGTPEDTVVREVSLEQLPVCYAREDIPDPCQRLEDIPDLEPPDPW